MAHGDFDNLTSSWGNFTGEQRGKEANASSSDACKNLAYFYAMGVVIPSGFFSNIFCLIVFSLSAGLRRTTTGHYLTALACADTLFLAGDFMRWLNMERCLNLNFMHTSNVACRVIYWLRYGAKLVSAWVTVAIATERFVTVAFPLQVSRLSTVGRAKVIIIVLFAIGLSLGSFSFWTLESDIPSNPLHAIKCIVPENLSFVYNAWNMAILVLGTLLLPGIFISVLTTLTIVILLRAKRRRCEHMEGQPVISPSHSTGQHRSPLSRTTSNVRGTSSAERQLTITLVAVCTAFIVLRLPYTIVYFLQEMLVMKRWPRVKVGLELARKVTDVIATSNYVVNLMLYCLFGSYFRQQVLVVYGCRRRRRGKGFGFGGGSGVGGGGANSIVKDSDYSCKSRSSTLTRTSIV